MSILRRSSRVLASAALAAALGAAPLGAPAASARTAGAATACPSGWGSMPEVSARYTSQQLTGVRAGRHACFDRVVLDVAGTGRGRPGFDVRYVARVRADGSGDVVPLRGGARLRVVLHAPAYDASGGATYRPPNPRELADVAGFSTLRQIAWAGSFEGQTTIGLGVRARLPVRTLVLDGPRGGYRLVVDVAHAW